MNSIIPISQRDERWKNVKLGDENAPADSTIGSVGCLLTSITMLIKHYSNEFNWTPDIVNLLLSYFNGYYKGNLIIHEKMAEIFPQIAYHGHIDCEEIPAPIPLIDAILPTVLKADSYLITTEVDGHWVLATEKITNNGKTVDYVINDPWTGQTTTLLKKYGKPGWNIERAIFGILKYSGRKI